MPYTIFHSTTCLNCLFCLNSSQISKDIQFTMILNIEKQQNLNLSINGTTLIPFKSIICCIIMRHTIFIEINVLFLLCHKVCIVITLVFSILKSTHVNTWCFPEGSMFFICESAATSGPVYCIASVSNNQMKSKCIKVEKKYIKRESSKRNTLIVFSL